MAGHSKFKNIQHRKGAQDKKRAKIFTKLVKEIVTSAKIGGDDPSTNPRLRAAIAAGRSQNLPKERIEKALSSASDPNYDDYVEIRYEGFAPGGIAIVVEALTDNKNRTASDIRSAFTKNGGNLGETGSVSFMFDRLGLIQYDKNIDLEDKAIETSLELGAVDFVSEDGAYLIYTAVEDFNTCLEGLIEKYGQPTESELIWKPQNKITIDDLEKASKLMKLIYALEDSDDVQNVFGNYDFPEEILAKLMN